MKETSLFGRKLLYRSKSDVREEKELAEKKALMQKIDRKPLIDYAKNNITAQSPEEFILNYKREDYDMLTLYTQQAAADIEQIDRPLLQKALDHLAQQALDEKCDYVVNVKTMGYNGMTSKAASGFVVGIGGTGFGSASPDGTFSSQIMLTGTGLKRKAYSENLEYKITD